MGWEPGGVLAGEPLGSGTPRLSGRFASHPALLLLPVLDFSPWPLSAGPSLSLSVFAMYLFPRCAHVGCPCSHELGCVVGGAATPRVSCCPWGVLLSPLCPLAARAGLSAPQCPRGALPRDSAVPRAELGTVLPLHWHSDCSAGDLMMTTGGTRPRSAGGGSLPSGDSGCEHPDPSGLWLGFGCSLVWVLGFSVLALRCTLCSCAAQSL